MREDVAKQFAANVNDTLSSTGFVDAWADVHGEYEAELVVQIDYRDEDTQRLRLENDSQALALFQLIFVSKEEGAEEALGKVSEGIADV